MTTRPLLLTCACLAVMLPASTLAQTPGPALAVAADTSQRQLIKLRDGSTVLGRITHSWGDSARVESMAGTLTVRRMNVASVKVIPASSIHDGVYWPEDPNATRLFFGPTARMLKKGEGYIANHWLFFMDGYGGVTDRFTLGGAMSLFPTDNFLKDNAYFLSPKVAITQGERFNTAAGVWIGGAPFNDEVDGENTFGIAYGVATWGGLNGAFTLGGGYGFAEGKLARNPMLMVGGTKRLSRRLSFVTENWIFPNVEDHPLVSAGLRTIGESVSWDFGFVTVMGTGTGTRFVPWLGAAWKF
ncbi:MAG: hypothetical protein Q8K55_06085 [Gemmatimonadaceae bacterium]|nr:hypothetical protein [Gemmatimonadaceae bacterium]